MVLMMEHTSQPSVALDPLIAEAKRRARQRRYTAALGALLLVALATGLALGFRSSGGGQGGGFATAAVPAHAGALVVPIPRGLHRYNIRGGFYRTGTRPPVIGASLTNYRVPADATLRTKGVLPLHARRTGAVLQVTRFIPLSSPGVLIGLHLPLSLNQDWRQLDLATGTLRYGFLDFDGQPYEIRVWIGRAAPAHDRAAILQALAAVHPAH